MPAGWKIPVQVPFIIVFNNFDNFAGRQFTGAVGIGLVQQLGAAAEFIVINKGAMGSLQIFNPVDPKYAQGDNYTNNKDEKCFIFHIREPRVGVGPTT